MSKLPCIAATLLLPLILAACNSDRGEWHTSSRASAGFAPLPVDEPEAVIQAYAAAAWGWRGWFGDHTWVATKKPGADSYTVYEVIGWRLRYNGSVVRIARDVPDRFWFGARPKLLLDVRGAPAVALVDRVDAAARRYPYAAEYKVFPGPNSNTFTAWIARQVPELQLKLPFRAFGRGYRK